MHFCVEYFEKFFQYKQWSDYDIMTYLREVYHENLHFLGRISILPSSRQIFYEERVKHLKEELQAITDYAEIHGIEL
jgi:hypothetical protein